MQKAATDSSEAAFVYFKIIILMLEFLLYIRMK